MSCFCCRVVASRALPLSTHLCCSCCFNNNNHHNTKNNDNNYKTTKTTTTNTNTRNNNQRNNNDDTTTTTTMQQQQPQQQRNNNKQPQHDDKNNDATTTTTTSPRTTTTTTKQQQQIQTQETTINETTTMTRCNNNNHNNNKILSCSLSNDDVFQRNKWKPISGTKYFSHYFWFTNNANFVLYRTKKKLYFGSYFTKITTNFKHVSRNPLRQILPSYFLGVFFALNEREKHETPEPLCACIQTSKERETLIL